LRSNCATPAPNKLRFHGFALSTGLYATAAGAAGWLPRCAEYPLVLSGVIPIPGLGGYSYCRVMTTSTVSDSTRTLPAYSDRPDELVEVAADAATSSEKTDSVDSADWQEAEQSSSLPIAAASAVGGLAVSAPLRSRTMSVLALSLGIASFFFAQSVVVPLAAVIFGVFGLRDEPTGRNFSIWGIVLACVATFGWVILLAAGALLFLPLAVISSL